jgi:hypothetical protein
MQEHRRASLKSERRMIKRGMRRKRGNMMTMTMKTNYIGRRTVRPQLQRAASLMLMLMLMLMLLLMQLMLILLLLLVGMMLLMMMLMLLLLLVQRVAIRSGIPIEASLSKAGKPWARSTKAMSTSLAMSSKTKGMGVPVGVIRYGGYRAMPRTEQTRTQPFHHYSLGVEGVCANHISLPIPQGKWYQEVRKFAWPGLLAYNRALPFDDTYKYVFKNSKNVAKEREIHY